MNTLPLFFFKPSICWVDDDQTFLDAVNISFKDSYNCLTFNCPLKAKEFLQSYQAPLLEMEFKREYTESDRYGADNHYPVDINIPAIKNLLNTPDVRNEIAVLIADYNMPGSNGINLFKQLTGLNAKKMLLTGEATHEKAVDAFNLGLINKFVKKDIYLADCLKNYIDELTYQYFRDKTAPLISHIEASSPSVFSDATFIHFFNEWRVRNNIVEYYLINKHGGFLTKNNEGELTYFVVMSEKDKKEFLSLNDELQGKASRLLDDFSKGQIIPFFGTDQESWDVDVEDWGNYFYPCEVIEGREKYYWAVVSADQ